MNGTLLKLDAPYSVIYAGGYVGRHIATLVTYTELKDGSVISESFPVLDLGEEYPAGKMVPVDIEDCRVLCPPGGTNLYWLAKIIEYDFQQLEPAGIDYMLGRMKLLDCFVKLPTNKNAEGEEVTKWDYIVSLECWHTKGPICDPNAEYRVYGGRHNGFYFQAEGTAKEIYNELSMQLCHYQDFFHDDLIRLTFQIDDYDIEKVAMRLNADQHIEGFEHEDYDW